MQATTNSGSTAASGASWICLAIAWICFIVPIPGIGLFIGWPLNLVAFILAIVAMAKRGAMSGLLQLLASLIVSPIIYFIGLAIFGAALTSAVEADGAGATDSTASSLSAPASADVPDTKPAMVDAIEITAGELFAAYKANEIAADQQYKGKALKVSGTVEGIASDAFDKPVVQLQAGGFMEQVHANVSSNDAAARLTKAEWVTLACEGAGEVLGIPVLNDCVIVD